MAIANEFISFISQIKGINDKYPCVLKNVYGMTKDFLVEVSVTMTIYSVAAP